MEIHVRPLHHVRALVPLQFRGLGLSRISAMSRRPARCTMADMRRALEAAERAGLYKSVDILPDGTIRFTRDEAGQPESGKDAPQPEIVL